MWGDVDRIESHSVSIGRPDVNLCLSGGKVWDIELKYTKSNRVVLRPAQYAWVRRRVHVGGNVLIIIRSDNGKLRRHLAVLGGDMPDVKHNRTLSAWELQASAIWIGKIDRDDLRSMLNG
jgi:hypothetical protein